MNFAENKMSIPTSHYEETITQITFHRYNYRLLHEKIDSQQPIRIYSNERYTLHPGQIRGIKITHVDIHRKQPMLPYNAHLITSSIIDVCEVTQAIYQSQNELEAYLLET